MWHIIVTSYLKYATYSISLYHFSACSLWIIVSGTATNLIFIPGVHTCSDVVTYLAISSIKFRLKDGDVMQLGRLLHSEMSLCMFLFEFVLANIYFS